MTNPQLEEDEGFPFSALSEDEKNILIPLPCRVGYWISQCDLDGGESAEQAEIQAIETMITSFAQDMCKSQFVQSLMEETVGRQAEWQCWQTGLDNVPEECKQACDFLSDKLSSRELSSFQETLFDIAYAVANIFRERPSGFSLELLMDKISGLFEDRKNDILYAPNISLPERAALKRLKDILT